MSKQKALLDRYPEPHWADGKRLKILREDLRVGQVELSKLAGISQVAISRIESGVRPFSKRARNKIWPVMTELLDQRIEETKSAVRNPILTAEYEKQRRPKESDKQKHGGVGSLSALSNSSRLEALAAESSPILKALKTPLTIEQQLQWEKNLLEAQLLGASEIIAGKDAQIATLIKALDAALEANADYAKLFALKGAAVAADELQQEIEDRQRKDKGEAD